MSFDTFTYPVSGLYQFLAEENITLADNDIRVRFYTDTNGDGTGVPDALLSSLTTDEFGKPGSTNYLHVDWTAPANNSTSQITGQIPISSNSNIITPEFQNTNNLTEPVTIWWMETQFYNGSTWKRLDMAKHNNNGIEVKTNQQIEVTSAAFNHGSPGSNVNDLLHPGAGDDASSPNEPNTGITDIVHDKLVNNSSINGYGQWRVIYIVDDGTDTGYRKKVTNSLPETGFGLDAAGYITVPTGTSTEVTFTSSDGVDGSRLENVALALYDGTNEQIFAVAKDVLDQNGNTYSISSPVDVQVNRFEFVI